MTQFSRCYQSRHQLWTWTRATLFITIITIGLAPLTAAAGLRGNIEITDKAITLGHLFDNAGSKAKVVVRHAPSPGKTIEFSMATLRALASDFQIFWDRPTIAGPILVRRKGVLLHQDMLQQAVMSELSKIGIQGTWKLAFNSIPENTWLPAKAIQLDRFPMHGFIFDADQGRFTGLIKIPTDRGLTRNIRFSGKAYEMTKVVTLRRALSRGSIVTAKDLAYRMFRTNQIRTSIFSDPREVIGLQTRRPLRAGGLIRSRDLQRPLMVRKNAVVTILVITPKMTLSTVGRALTNASVGDVIPVLNEQSKRTIKARVVNHDTVHAITRQRVAMVAGK